jgi:hypothetical protein
MTIGAAMVRQAYSAIAKDPGSWSQLEVYRDAFRYYLKAVQALKRQLAKVKCKADTRMWEISLVASYGFTAFESLIGNDEGAFRVRDFATFSYFCI